jgi:hypothetical protein
MRQLVEFLVRRAASFQVGALVASSILHQRHAWRHCTIIAAEQVVPTAAEPDSPSPLDAPGYCRSPFELALQASDRLPGDVAHHENYSRHRSQSSWACLAPPKECLRDLPASVSRLIEVSSPRRSMMGAATRDGLRSRTDKRNWHDKVSDSRVDGASAAELRSSGSASTWYS